jgi:hypothetical protein
VKNTVKIEKKREEVKNPNKKCPRRLSNCLKTDPKYVRRSRKVILEKREAKKPEKTIVKLIDAV